MATQSLGFHPHRQRQFGRSLPAKLLEGAAHLRFSLKAEATRWKKQN
jgi:hypothetical protein